MKAAVLRAPDGLDGIEVHDIPDPGQPGPGQIRIALHATSLCAGHAQQLGGESPPPNLMEVKG